MPSTDIHGGRDDVALAMLDDIAADRHGRLGLVDAKGERTRFHDESHVWVVEREPGRVHGEADRSLLAGLEWYAREAAEEELMAGDRRHVVTHHELDDIHPGTVARVLAVDRHDDRVRGRAGRFDRERRV